MHLRMSSANCWLFFLSRPHSRKRTFDFPDLQSLFLRYFIITSFGPSMYFFVTFYPPCRICASVNRISIGSDNGLSPIRRRAINLTKARLLSIGPLGTNFREFFYIKILNFSFKKVHLKKSSAKWWRFCPGRDELNQISQIGETFFSDLQSFCPTVKLDYGPLACCWNTVSLRNECTVFGKFDYFQNQQIAGIVEISQI